LTTLFGSTAVPTIAALPVKDAPKKRGWLPLLTVLFLISYGLMTMLIVEQGQTIESQRSLIRELFRDSTELSAMKMKAQQAANAGRTQTSAQNQTQHSSTQTPSTQTPLAQTPLSQAPLTQAPAIQSPSSQAAPQRRTQNQSEKKHFQMPSRPASDLGDDRRSLKTI